jgi:tetratricopeptide (TPR) repeat protein
MYSGILLSENKFQAALDTLLNSKASPIPDFIYPAVLEYNVPSLHDALARAYIGLHRIDDAIAVYERLITFDPKNNDRRLIHPKYHYYLALLYEEKGLKNKAIEQYHTFLALWKDAADVFPEPADARKRLDKLLKG